MSDDAISSRGWDDAPAAPRFSGLLRSGWLRAVRHWPSLDSTNGWAVAHAAQLPSAAFPLLVVADEQTAGRGRGDRRWHADAGTLTFSIVLDAARAGVPRHRVPTLGLVAGLAVAEAIEGFVPPISARLKWPNDVYVAGRKVAGILAQVACGERIVIGIGVNVATDLAAAPEEVRRRAISLAEVALRPLERYDLLPGIVERLEERMKGVSGRFASLVAPLRDRCLLQGQRVRVQQGAREIGGRCLGIADDGALCIETPEGPLAVRSGEVIEFGSR